MEHRQLVRGGRAVSVIGFGAFKIGRNEKVKYPAGYKLPTFEQAERLLNGVLDLGINYIDTAPAYGHSEEWIGRALAARRGEYLLSTKVGETFEKGESAWDYTAQGVQHSLERSLQRLRTDVLDLVYIHSNGDDEAVLLRTDAVPTLERLRDSGKVRWIGLSGYTEVGARAAMSWADAIMVEYHLNDRRLSPVIEEAARRGCGVAVKKPLGSGRLDPRQALEFVLATPGVATAVVGSLSLEHLRENLRIAEQGEVQGQTRLEI